MNSLDSLSGVKKYDKSGMLALIESFPEQCLDAKHIAYEFEPHASLKKKYGNIVCLGMGGSAIGADLVRSYIADESATPLFVNRNYTLPRFVDEDTLVVASSYSGDTEETLSAYRDARSRGSEIVALSSGGRLSRMAKDDGVSVITIPAGLPPRAALGYSFFPILVLLSKLGIIKDQAAHIDDAIKSLRRLKGERLGMRVKTKDNQAKRIASMLYGRIPFIYAGCEYTDSVATRWRGQLAENSKTLASCNVFPEMNHNELVGWENPRRLLKGCAAVILRDAGDHPKISRRMDITKRILRKEGFEVTEVNSSGKELLARIFSLVYTGDFVSLYLALLNGADPYSVDRITYMKKELAK